MLVAPGSLTLICMRKFYDWAAVQRFYDAGNDYRACKERFGFTVQAWYKAIRRGKLRANPSVRKRYDWSAIQAYYDEGHSYRECRDRFGFANAAWTKAVRRGDIKPRRQAMPIEELLSSSRRCRGHVKIRLIRAGLLPLHCAICGIAEWLNQPLSLELDHINGMKGDHRLENLRLLCPNCHSQTPTWGGRNVKRVSLLQDPWLAV